MCLTTVLSHGRAVIPAALREQLGLKNGDRLVWTVRDGELVAITRSAQLRRAQLRYQRCVPKGSPSLVDELLADRRAEDCTGMPS